MIFLYILLFDIYEREAEKKRDKVPRDGLTNITLYIFILKQI